MKFRKKPIVIEAEQWIKNIDGVDQLKSQIFNLSYNCKHCNKPSSQHGWIETLEGGHIVCHGDWIITGVNGEKYPCKPDIFEKTYEQINE